GGGPCGNRALLIVAGGCGPGSSPALAWPPVVARPARHQRREPPGLRVTATRVVPALHGADREPEAEPSAVERWLASASPRPWTPGRAFVAAMREAHYSRYS